MPRTSNNGTKEPTAIGALLERCPDTLGEIAEKLGVDASLVSRWVSGRRKPTASQLAELESLYAVPDREPPSSRPVPPRADEDDRDDDESNTDRLRRFIREGLRELQNDAQLSGVKKAEALKKLVEAQVALDRSTGENALTLTRIVAHPEFRRAAKAMVDGACPTCLPAIIKALESVSG